jgi:hypothetical protein
MATLIIRIRIRIRIRICICVLVRFFRRFDPALGAKYVDRHRRRGPTAL